MRKFFEGFFKIFAKSKEKAMEKPVKRYDPYAGDALDKNFSGLGMPRLAGESDWEYRKRMFPSLYQKSGRSTAVSILFGCSITELSEEDKTVYRYLSFDPKRGELVSFAKGFPEDPKEYREKK